MRFMNCVVKICRNSIPSCIFCIIFAQITSDLNLKHLINQHQEFHTQYFKKVSSVEMGSKLFFVFLVLALTFRSLETGYILQRGFVFQIHAKQADGRRIVFVRGNCASDKIFSTELRMCVKFFKL